MINAIIYKQHVDIRRFPIGYKYPKILTELLPYTKKEDKTQLAKAKLKQSNVAIKSEKLKKYISAKIVTHKLKQLEESVEKPATSFTIASDVQLAKHLTTSTSASVK